LNQAFAANNMSSTPVSLLERLKVAGADSPDWLKLHDLYLPLIKSWLAQISGTRDESDDLAQEVLIVLVRELPGFQSRGAGSFRAWLRQITINQTRAYFKKRRKQPAAGVGGEDESVLAQLEDPSSALSLQWDRDHDRQVSHKLLDLVKNDFEPTTWEAFVRFALHGEPAAAVARELGMSENAVLLAKSRILKRLRQEAGDFLS
jgi:RNA polymerase sigma-70 factor (ECF subfamily)